MAETTLVVDGSNIATEGRTAPSLRQLDEAVTAFMAERSHDHVIVVVDATFGHRIDASEVPRFEEAILDGDLVTPPAGAIGRGDAFILQIADKSGANVLSNDSFQEFHGTYEWLFDEGRLIGGKPVPPIGWVFVDRTPVRGPISRRAVRESRKKTGAAPAAKKQPSKQASKQPAKQAAKKDPAPSRSRRTSAAASEPMPVPTTPPPGKRPPRMKTMARPPVNDSLPFLQFVTEHPIGGEVVGEVVEFSSHGAYVTVGQARCYVPLKAMGTPPPRSAREVLTLGEQRSFVVQSFDTSHRGIDLALRGSDGDATDPLSSSSQLLDTSSTAESAEEATLAAKKATAKKAPAKKAPAKKTVAKKAPAKKAPAKKTVAKKAPAKKAPAKKTVAKKAPAKKAPAKKTVAKKAPAKKAPAKKTVAKKAPAKKAPAKKTVAKKAPAKKAPARKAPAKKTAAKKR